MLRRDGYGILGSQCVQGRQLSRAYLCILPGRPQVPSFIRFSACVILAKEENSNLMDPSGKCGRQQSVRRWIRKLVDVVLEFLVGVRSVSN